MSSSQSDHIVKDWTVEVSIDEHRDIPGRRRGCAGAIRSRWASVMARLNPADRNVAEIGDELGRRARLVRSGQAIDGGHRPRHRSVTHQPVTVLH